MNKNNLSPSIDPGAARKRIKPFAYFILFFAGIGGALYGYDIGVITGTLLFIQKSIHFTPNQLSFFVASMLVGGALSILITGPLADIFGRRQMISVAGIIFIIGILILITANSYHAVLLGRLIQGVGVGIITIIIPLYLIETAPSAIRGRSVTVFQLFLTGGIVVASAIDLIFAPTGNWRAMFACVLVPAIILSLGSFCLVNSPRWLFSKGRKEEAYKALLRSQFPEEADLDMQEMEQMKFETTNTSIAEFMRKLTKRQYAIPFIIALAIACFNQLTGINSILQFSALILNDTGLGSTFVSMIGSVVVTAINFIVTIIAILLIDKLGRKPLLVTGTAGVAISLIYSGFVCLLANSPLKGVLLTIGLCGFIAFFAIGPGVVVWLALSELLPMSIRSKGMAVCLFVNSMVSSLLASIFMGLVSFAGYQTVFWLCGLCTVAYCLVAIISLPETKGKTLEQIEEIFQNKAK
jgi:SP family galactose:H+ symporter-like MFS transporter